MSLEAVLFDRPERHRLTPSVRGSMKTSFAMAAIYWGCTAAGLAPAVGQLLVTLLIVTWSVLGQLAGVYVDACYPVEVVFRWLVVLCCGPHHQHLLDSFMVHAGPKKADATFAADAAPRAVVEEETVACGVAEAAALDYGIEEFSAEEAAGDSAATKKNV